MPRHKGPQNLQPGQLLGGNLQGIPVQDEGLGYRAGGIHRQDRPVDEDSKRAQAGATSTMASKAA